MYSVFFLAMLRSDCSILGVVARVSLLHVVAVVFWEVSRMLLFSL